MFISNNVAINDAEEPIYWRAIARLEKELDWTPSQAQAAIAGFAAAHGVFLDEVAEAVLAAASIKRGLSRALNGLTFIRRPPACLTEASTQ